MKRFLMILVFMGLACSAFAREFAPRPYPMPVYDRGVVRMEIIGDANGRIPIQSTCCGDFEHCRGGTGVIRVSKGERYRLSVTNLTGRRIGLVIAVDGRNILNGNRSYGRSSEAMYILSPFQTGEFTGWRTSRSEVRRFYFTDAEDSYAANLGDDGRIGQITVAAYHEEEPEPPIDFYSQNSRDKASGRPLSPSARSESQSPGTGWGERDYSPVRSTRFDAEGSPAAQYTIRYEWERWRHRHPVYPNHRDGGYCPEPSRSSHRR